jgi:septal ring-binding cell division protein DamX
MTMTYPSEPTTEQVAAPQPAPLPNQKPVVEFGFPVVGVGIIAVLVLVLVLIGVGLAAAAPAGAMSSSQTKFVKDVRNLDPTAATASNKQIVKLGNEVCTDLRSGTSVKRLVLSGTEKAILVEAATVLCPTYKAKVA